MVRTWIALTAFAALLGACATDGDVPPQCRATKGAQVPAKPAAETLPAGNEVDWQPPTCGGALLPPICPSPTVVSFAEEAGALHISLPEAITWAQSPPSSGNHRGEWAKWGEYTYLPPQRWLHNLEHGGAALLYNPCADPKIINDLRGFARCRPTETPGGPFRWVLTPYANLPRRLAVVTWKWTLMGDCFDADAVEAFLKAHYRQTEEDIGSHGSWSYGYMGM